MNIQFISHLISNIGCSAMIAFFFIKIDRANIIIKSNLQETQKRLDIIHKNEKTISEETLEIIVCALQLLQGHYIKKSVEELQEKVIFYMYGGSEEIPNRANSILKEPLYNNNFLYRTLEFFFNLSENDRKKWQRAFQLFISYKNSNNKIMREISLFHDYGKSMARRSFKPTEKTLDFYYDNHHKFERYTNHEKLSSVYYLIFNEEKYNEDILEVIFQHSDYSKGIFNKKRINNNKLTCYILELLEEFKKIDNNSKIYWKEK